MPAPFEPMLATPWSRPFDDPGWAFELKWDGIRALLHSDREAKLLSRNGNSLNDRFPTLATPGLDAVLDGEVVAMDASGLPSFGLLQQGSAASYLVFDLLKLGDTDVRGLPLTERLEMLGSVELPDGYIRSNAVAGEGEALFAATLERGLEGIVAKRFDSTYRAGRSASWRKVVHNLSARAVVCGYTTSDSGAPFAGLVLGMWEGNQLRFVGRVGTGFSNDERAAIRSTLDQIVTDTAPFATDDRFVATEPVLVAHVQFRGWTEGGKLRAPSFKGFGAEPAETITWEVEGP